MLVLPPKRLYHCEIGEAAVFLDLCRDRYFMIKGDLLDAFRAFRAGHAAPAHLEALIKAAVLTDMTSAPPDISSPAPIPSSSAIEGTLAKPSLWLVLETILAQLRARHDLKRRSLHAIIADLEKRAQRATRSGNAISANIASAFVQSRRYVAYEDNCLSRGIAMMRMLLRRQCRASLSLGVTLPFAAHCWVQIDDEVLTDRLDQVRTFTPIFSVSTP